MESLFTSQTFQLPEGYKETAPDRFKFECLDCETTWRHHKNEKSKCWSCGKPGIYKGVF
jgi:hypothetical protein